MARSLRGIKDSVAVLAETGSNSSDTTEKSLGDRRKIVVADPNYKTTLTLLNLGTAEAMEVVKTCQNRKGADNGTYAIGV